MALRALLLIALTLAGAVSARPSFVGASELGDVSCDDSVTSVDAALILQADAGLLSSLPCGEKADVDGSGDVSALDALLVLQFSAGLLEGLGPGEPPAGFDYEGEFLSEGSVSFRVDGDRTEVVRFAAELAPSCLQDVQVFNPEITSGQFYFEQPNSSVSAGFEVSGVLGPRLQPPLSSGEATGTVSFYGCDLYDVVWTASEQ